MNFAATYADRQTDFRAVLSLQHKDASADVQQERVKSLTVSVFTVHTGDLPIG